MKRILFIFAILLLSVSGFTQNSVNYYFGRLTPVVKKEKLPEVVYVGDILDEMWIDLIMPYEERLELEARRKQEYSVGTYLYPTLGYEMLIDYDSVEIFVRSKGELLSSISSEEKLTTEQKKLLNSADLGSDIHIKISYSYKKQAKDQSGADRKIVHGFLDVNVVPETEAEFPGGFNQLTKYLMDNVIHKVDEAKYADNLLQASVKFAIDEEGRIVHAGILNSSGDQKIDKLILEAMNKMPKWKPAEDSKGIKVQQEFRIPFGGGAGC
jgi:TonB family protein